MQMKLDLEFPGIPTYKFKNSQKFSEILGVYTGLTSCNV